jgi:putative acetyltransferase
MSIALTQERADSAEAVALLEARDASDRDLYPPETQFRIPVQGHARDDVLFFVLREDGVAIGCGALKLCGGYAEMKSVFIVQQARGRRLGQAIVRRLEEAARELGYEEIRLETGNLSPWAIRTYERAGYSACPRFGDYPENPHSVFMAKRLPTRAVMATFAMDHARPIGAAGTIEGERP